MKKIYLAAPFTSHTTEAPGKLYGKLDDQNFIQFLEEIEDVFNYFGFNVSLPHRDKGHWGAVYIDPCEIADICFKEVETSDWIVAIPKKSRAVHMEIAIAVLLRKKIIILLKDDDDPSIFIYGLPRLTPTIIQTYTNQKDLIDQLKKAITLMIDHGNELTFLQEYSQNAINSVIRHTISCQIKESGLVAKRYAVIDFGSSSLKLTIADITKGLITPIVQKKYSEAPLGDDVYFSGNIKIDTVNKNISIIKEWVHLCKEWGVDAINIVSTGAARTAGNKQLLIQVIEDETGIELEIITQEAEAHILYYGTIFDFNANDVIYAVLNIGGSTTELIIGNKESIFKTYHFEEMGVRLLRASFLKNDPPTNYEHDEMIRFIQKSISEISINFRHNEVVFLHTGGELDYVISAGCKLFDYKLSDSHPKAALLSDFEEFSERIRGMSSEELYKLAPDPSNPRWMDGAIVCNGIALCVGKKLGLDMIVPSNRNLTDGILLMSK